VGCVRWTVGAAISAVLAASVGGGAGEGELDGFGRVVDSYTAYGSTGPGHREHLTSGSTEVGGERTAEEWVGVAVGLLLHHGRSTVPGFVNFWAGACAPGQQVVDVELQPGLVTVQVTGEVRRHDACRLTRQERAARQQQLAWTVTEELDPFAEEDPPTVRLVEADGSTWDAVADLAYLPPDDPRRAGS
jgi:hypothetical protein